MNIENYLSEAYLIRKLNQARLEVAKSNYVFVMTKLTYGMGFNRGLEALTKNRDCAENKAALRVIEEICGKGNVHSEPSDEIKFLERAVYYYLCGLDFS